MPKKSKSKDKNTGKPKSGHTQNGAGASTSNCVKVQYLENPVKSEIDKNEYRVITLPNNLVALLISCSNNACSDGANICASQQTSNQDKPNTSKDIKSGKKKYPDWYKKAEIDPESNCDAAICCLCINVGSFSDPRQVPGVSRVLSATFAEPIFKKDHEMSDDYKKVVKDNDITSYVFNNSETTVFSFSVPQHVLREVINRLAQSFVCSVTTRHQVEKERAAVEKQYHEDVEDFYYLEDRATEFILSQLVGTRHPVRTFGENYLEGLCQTTDEELYREVLKFRKRHYSANRMTVVIKADSPLDTLENFAKECFTKISNNGLPAQKFDPYNFANSFKNTKFRRIWKDPFVDDIINYEMVVNWIMPPSSWLYRTKSLEYLGWIFQNHCTGSLMSYLKKKRWAKGLDAGVCKEDSTNTSLYSIFSVTIELTKAGNDNKIEVLDAIYSYVNMLRREGPQERIYNEIRIIKDAKFRYSDYFHLLREHRCRKLSQDMHLYQSTDYLTGPILYYEYDPVSITTCMDLMTPTKACIIVSHDNFGKLLKNKPSISDKDNYESTEIPEDWIERWKTIEPLKDFKLPGVNIYCPNDFTLVDPPKILLKYPVKVYSDSMTEVWYKFDAMSGVSKCRIRFCYVTPLSVDSLENRTMLDLYAEVLENLMADELYPAMVAGLSYTIRACSLGLQVTVDGFTHKLSLLSQTIGKYITKSRNLLTKSLFETMKKQLFELYKMRTTYSLDLADDIRLSILKPGHWSDFEKYASISSIEFDKFQHFMKQFVDHVYMKFLVEGNFSEANATEYARKIVEISKCGCLLPNTMPQCRTNEIPRGRRCCRVKCFGLQSRPSCLKNYYQFDDSTMKLGVIIDLFIMILTNKRFSKLMKNCPKMKVSWFPVAAKDRFDVNNYILTFVEYGDSMDIERMASIEEGFSEILKFVKKFSKDFTDEEWNCAKEIFIESKHEVDDNVWSEFSRNWDEIIMGDYTFDRQSRELDVISGLEPDDFRQLMSNITEDSFNTRKLSIQVLGSNCIQVNSSSVKVEPNGSNTETKSSSTPPYQLEYLTDYPNEKGKMLHYYIDDIEKYRSGLKVLPSNNVTIK